MKSRTAVRAAVVALFAWLADESLAQIASVNDATIVELADPSALCNDGRHAKYSYKLANPASRDWIIHLQGGGQCVDAESCAKRWFDAGDYDDGQTGGYTGMVPGARSNFADGHLDFTRPANPFSGQSRRNFGKPMNRLWVEYCSSDLWTGRGGVQSTDPATPGSLWNPANWTTGPAFPPGGVGFPPGPPGYPVCTSGRSGSACADASDDATCDSSVGAGDGKCTERERVIVFAGANIVDAVVRTLIDGGVTCGRSGADAGGIPSDCAFAGEASRPVVDGGVPPQVILSGSSAGSAGVIQNVDAVGAAFAGAGVQAYLMGIADSSNGLGLQGSQAVTSARADASHRYWSGDRALQGGQSRETRTDDSCAMATGAPCTVLSGILANHVQSRLFVVENGLDTGPHELMYEALREYHEGNGMLPSEAAALASACIRASITTGIAGILSAFGANKHWRITNYVASNSDGGLHQQLTTNDRMYATSRSPSNAADGSPRDGTSTTSLASTLDLARCMSRGGCAGSLRATRVKLPDARLRAFLSTNILGGRIPIPRTSDFIQRFCLLP